MRGLSLLFLTLLLAIDLLIVLCNPNNLSVDLHVDSNEQQVSNSSSDTDGQSNNNDDDSVESTTSMDHDHGSENNGDSGTRIIGGGPAKNGQIPYQVHLRPAPGLKGTHCGGTIISKNWVLTAGHCVVKNGKKANPSTKEVTTGNVDDKKQPIRLKIARIVVHPHFVNTKAPHFRMENDIALIQVQGNLIDKGVTSAAKLPDPSQSFVGRTATTSGFGRTSGTNEHSQPRVLKTVNLPVVPDKQCSNKPFIPQQMICVGGTETENTCQGDSGGPLAIREPEGNTVIGITSFGPKNCNGPTVFTKVSYYLPFIKKVTGIR